ncbi:MAG: transcriptional initiation protein Tat, partial [Actinomycetota bacterium]
MAVAALLVAAATIAVPAGPVTATPGGTTTETVTETVTLDCTGAPLPWTVPAGVTSIGVELVGGAGG